MLFEFNVYSSLLLPCFVQGVIFTFIYFYQAYVRQETHWGWLAGIILFYTFYVGNWMIGFAGWYDAHDSYTTFAYYFPWVNWFMIGPLVYFFFRTLTNRQFQFQRRDWWHLALPLASYLHTVVLVIVDLLIIRSFPEENHYGTFGYLRSLGYGPFGPFLQAVAYVSIFYYFILTIRQFRGYQKYLADHFSETERLNFNWLKHVLYAIVLAQAIWVIFEVASLIKGESLAYVDDWYKFMATGILIYYISLTPFRNEPAEARQLAFQPTTNELPNEPEASSAGMPVGHITEHLQANKLYLQEQLTLHDLAKSLQLPTSIVSKVLNDQLGQNFNACINGFRVEEAKERLLDPQYQHLSILGIAYDCGFSSKATFNRVFKQQTGLSPSEWRKESKSNS